MKITFLGDISLNNRYNDLYKEKSDPFKKVSDILYDADLVIGNLESPSEGISENKLKSPRLKTKKETLNYLKNINLNLALLANNHIYDNLEDGFKNTIDALNDLKISYIGAGYTAKEAAKPFYCEKDNTKICILNYVTKDTNPNLPKDSKVFLNLFDEQKVIADIKEFSALCDKVILCLHWGGKVEGFYYPDHNQIFLTERLFENGVDLIIGHHSHTIQPKYLIGNKRVYFSLGNFCFDDVIITPEKTKEIESGKGTESLIVISEIHKKRDIEFSEVLINKKNLHLEVDKGILKKIKKRQFVFKYIKTNKVLWKMLKFKNQYFDSVMFYFFGNNHKFVNQIKKINLAKLINYLTRVL